MADEFNRTGTGDTGPDGVQGRAQQLQHAARESGRDLLDQAVARKDELKARAGSALDDGRHQVSDRVGSIARALHSTAENLEQDGDRQMSQWVHQAADQVDRVVGYLNGRDAGGLMHDMEDLARRNPALFLGGTYAAGLALGRFLRASSPERRPADDAQTSAQFDTYGAENPSTGSPWTGVGVSRDSFGAGVSSSSSGSGGFGASGAQGEGTRTDGSSGFGASGGRTDGMRADDMVGEQYGATAPRGSVPLGSSADDPGLTDEDLRTAWHERDARREQAGMRSASRTDAADDLDTGELTRYTNDDPDRSREV